MAAIELRGVVLDDTGAAVNGATVELYDVDTTTPVRATTTTDSSGLWAISHSTRGRFDVKITNGSDVVWLRARDRFQVSAMTINENAANQEALIVTRSEDAASLEVAIFEGDRATPADNDLAYISLRMSDDAGNQDEQARIGWSATTVANGVTQDGDLILSCLVNGTLTEQLRLNGSDNRIDVSTGIQITNDGAIRFGDSSTTGLISSDGSNTKFNVSAGTDLLITDTQVEKIRYDGGDDNLVFQDGVDLVLGAATLFVNDSANANMTVGLTVNQGASDDEILALKSSDVAHTRTGVAEADTYGAFRKASATLGGLRMDALAEDDALTSVLDFQVRGGTADTTKTTGGVGLVNILVTEITSNSDDNITADGNVFAVRARVGGSAVTRLLVDEDGDLYSVTAAQTFDDYDDVALIDSYDRIRSGYMDWVKEHEQQLIDMKVLGGPVAEGGLTNQTQLIRVLTGAVRQLGSRLAIAEQKLAALPEGK